MATSEPPVVIRNTGARIRTYPAGSWKLVETSKGERLLIDLVTDPGEERNVADTRPQQLARLLDELGSWRAALGFPAIAGEREYGEVPELDSEARERLRALGYLE